MDKKHKILSINPGSTSTKIALYENEVSIFSDNIEHKSKDLEGFKNITDQFAYRKKIIELVLFEKNIAISDLSAVVGRGGLLPRMKTGGYLVNDVIEEMLKSDEIPSHASNLGGLIAKEIADSLGIPAYIYDAVTSAELPDVAKVTGIPEITRQSFCHVLNSRAKAMEYANSIKTSYDKLELLVAHIGGGVSISVHSKGAIVDSLSDDDGQFSPERSGSVPLLNLIDLCYSGNFTKDEIKRKVRGKGGMYAHLGTSNCKEIEERIGNGDAIAKLVYEAQAYQIAKGICLLLGVLNGKFDAIILTGGVAHSEMLTDMVIKRVEFAAPVVVLPGENEMEALSLGVLRILRNEETPREYK